MTQEMVIALMKNTLWTMLVIAGPILILGLVAGVLVGIFQAVTQIQEMTLTFIPKILLVALALALFLPWMLNRMITFTLEIFQKIPGIH